MKNKKVKKSAKTETADVQGPLTKADKKMIENHKKAATHHIEASKHHMDAIKHYEAGNYEKAAHSTLLAHGHHAMAGGYMSDDAQHHVQVLKQARYHF